MSKLDPIDDGSTWPWYYDELSKYHFRIYTFFLINRIFVGSY